MSKKIEIPLATKGYGYVGTWSDNRIGWFMPRHVYGKYDRKFPNDSTGKSADEFVNQTRAFLCEISIKPLIDKRGRPITKIIKIKK